MTIRPALWWRLASVMFTVTGLAQEVSVSQKPKLKAFTIVNPARDANGNMLRPADASASSALATFNYTTVSSRDGNTYSGVMVGQDPFSSGPFTTTTVDTPIIPLIITTKSVAFKVSKGGILSRIKGFTTFDPTAADNACLSSPNNVPIGLAVQSPIFQATDFSFGPTSVGTTQYIDAFQRGNFSLQARITIRCSTRTCSLPFTLYSRQTRLLPFRRVFSAPADRWELSTSTPYSLFCSSCWPQRESTLRSSQYF